MVSSDRMKQIRQWMTIYIYIYIRKLEEEVLESTTEKVYNLRKY